MGECPLLLVPGLTEAHGVIGVPLSSLLCHDYKQQFILSVKQNSAPKTEELLG